MGLGDTPSLFHTVTMVSTSSWGHYFAIRPLAAIWSEWRAPWRKGKYPFFETWTDGHERFFFIGRLYVILTPGPVN